MRKRGTGTIEERDGRFFPRLPGRSSKRLDPCDTHEEAERVLEAALRALQRDPAEGGLSLGTWGDQAIDRRELQGQRSARSYRSVWHAHVHSHPLSSRPLVSIVRADVAAWASDLATRRVSPGRCHGEHVARARAARTISKQTAANALNLLRVLLEDGVELGLLTHNPARDVRLPTAVRKRPRTHSTWTYLTPVEQARLLACEAIPRRDRLMLAFALGTGGRETELWHVREADVSLAERTVTFRTTKNGRPRTVAMLPLAVEAVRAWLPLLREERAAHVERAAKKGEARQLDAWLWPSPMGHRRSGAPSGWHAWLKSAGLTAEQRRDGKRPRFHDLRHTCGTSLCQGWWGRRWAKEEVQVQLDHESVTTTERYVHLDGAVAIRAADATPDLTTNLTTLFGSTDGNVSDFEAPPARIELATNGLGSPSGPEHTQRLTIITGESVVTSLSDLAEDVLRLAAARDGRVVARAVELAERVLDERADQLKTGRPA